MTKEKQVVLIEGGKNIWLKHIPIGIEWTAMVKKSKQTIVFSPQCRFGLKQLKLETC